MTYVLTFYCGAIVGFFVAALCVAAKHGDAEAEREARELEGLLRR